MISEFFEVRQKQGSEADRLKNISENIIRAISTYTDFSVSIGLSSAEEGIASIKSSYLRALNCVRNRFLSDPGSIFLYDGSADDPGDHEESRMIIRKIRGSLHINIKYMDPEAFCNVLDDVCVMIMESGKLSLLNTACLEFLGWINNRIAELQLNRETCNSVSSINPDELFELDDINQIKRFLTGKAEKIFRCAAEISNYSPVIRKAIEYMQKNHHKNLSLSDIASNVNLSKSYLSTVFSEETGRNLIDYLTDYRVEMAKRMLLDEGLRIYEIACSAGFSSERYFSQIFKNRTGLTPTEYRRLNHGP